MPHIVIAGKLHISGLKLIENLSNITFKYIPDEDPQAYLKFISEAEGLVIRTQKLDAENIATASKLKIVSRHGVGYDNVDDNALQERGIPLAIVGDVNSRTVAEHAMTLLLCASRRILKSAIALRRGEWAQRNQFEPREVYCKSLLIVGYGRIGQHLRLLAQAFGMHVMAYDPFLTAHDFKGVEKVEKLHDGLSRADCVSLHVPKTKDIIIGAKELSLLPRHAIIVNTARGGIIDETALVKALQNQNLGAVGLDVISEEPPNRNHPLFDFENVIITPHSAGLTEECAERMAIKSVQNVLDFFDENLDPALVVNEVRKPFLK